MNNDTKFSLGLIIGMITISLGAVVGFCTFNEKARRARKTTDIKR